MYLMIDNYDSFTYNLYALFIECGVEMKMIKNNEYISADDFKAIVISPGPSSPKNSGTSMDYLRNYAGRKPFFGVCLGMQCIAEFSGYTVKQAVSIQHGKTDTIKTVNDSMLFRGLPECFTAVRYHSLAADIMDEYVTSVSASDGTVMSIENFKNKLFGVQFHPESILSQFGKKIITNFINYADGE